MSSTAPVPATSAPATSAPATKAAAASAIVVQQHPIIKLIVAAALIWFLAGKAEKLWSAHETHVFDSQNATLVQQVKTNAALAQQSAQQAQDYKTLLEQVTTREAAASRATKQQQATDATLSPDALATRWDTLIKQASGVHPIQNGYTVTQEAATATVQAIDGIPELQGKIADDATVLAAQATLVGDLNAQVTGLQKQNAEEVTTCNAQVSAVKAADAVKLHAARKHWFIIGYVAGFASAAALKIVGV